MFYLLLLDDLRYVLATFSKLVSYLMIPYVQFQFHNVALTYLSDTQTHGPEVASATVEPLSDQLHMKFFLQHRASISLQPRMTSFVDVVQLIA